EAPKPAEATADELRLVSDMYRGITGQFDKMKQAILGRGPASPFGTVGALATQNVRLQEIITPSEEFYLDVFTRWEDWFKQKSAEKDVSPLEVSLPEQVNELINIILEELSRHLSEEYGLKGVEWLLGETIPLLENLVFKLFEKKGKFLTGEEKATIRMQIDTQMWDLFTKRKRELFTRAREFFFPGEKPFVRDFIMGTVLKDRTVDGKTMPKELSRPLTNLSNHIQDTIASYTVAYFEHHYLRVRMKQVKEVQSGVREDGSFSRGGIVEREARVSAINAEFKEAQSLLNRILEIRSLINANTAKKDAAEKELERLQRIRTERFPVLMKAKVNRQKAAASARITELEEEMQRQKELLKQLEKEASRRMKKSKKLRKRPEEAGVLDLSELRYEIKYYTSQIAELSMEISRLIRARNMASEIRDRYDKAEKDLKKKETDLEAAKVALLTFIEEHFEPAEFYRIRAAIREEIGEDADLKDVFAGLEAGEKAVAVVDIADERKITISSVEQAEKLRTLGKARFHRVGPPRLESLTETLREERLIQYLRSYNLEPGEVLHVIIADKSTAQKRRHILELYDKGIPIYCTTEEKREKLDILREDGVPEAFQDLGEGEKLIAAVDDKETEIMSEEHARELAKRYDAKFYLVTPARRIQLIYGEDQSAAREFWKAFNEGARAYAEISDTARETWASNFEHIESGAFQVAGTGLEDAIYLLNEIQKARNIEETGLEIYRVTKEQESPLRGGTAIRAVLRGLEDGEKVVATVRRVELDIKTTEHAEKLAEDGVKLYRVREEERVKLGSASDVEKIFEESETAGKIIAKIGDEEDEGIEVKSIIQARKLLERAGVRFYLRKIEEEGGVEKAKDVEIEEYKDVERILKVGELQEDEKVFVLLHGERTQVESVEDVKEKLGELTDAAKFYKKEYRNVRLTSMDEVVR
ncbi:MAG: hypothetical protein WBB86_04090, partial [Candidatus Omnitrophota bacterium]